MNAILSKLGVPSDVQAFFNINDLTFFYGDDVEVFDWGMHRVPTTPNLWTAGNALTREVIITHSAMEAIAFLSLNRHRYPDLQRLSFVAIGNLPHSGQLHWIKENFRGRNLTLVFGNDLLGRLADIKVAAGIRNKRIRLFNSPFYLRITFGTSEVHLSKNRISLNAMEKSLGLRTGIKTVKPKNFDTYLQQLQHEYNHR